MLYDHLAITTIILLPVIIADNKTSDCSDYHQQHQRKLTDVGTKVIGTKDNARETALCELSHLEEVLTNVFQVEQPSSRLHVDDQLNWFQ